MTPRDAIARWLPAEPIRRGGNPPAECRWGDAGRSSFALAHAPLQLSVSCHPRKPPDPSWPSIRAHCCEKPAPVCPRDGLQPLDHESLPSFGGGPPMTADCPHGGTGFSPQDRNTDFFSTHLRPLSTEEWYRRPGTAHAERTFATAIDPRSTSQGGLTGSHAS